MPVPLPTPPGGTLDCPAGTKGVIKRNKDGSITATCRPISPGTGFVAAGEHGDILSKLNLDTREAVKLAFLENVSGDGYRVGENLDVTTINDFLSFITNKERAPDNAISSEDIELLKAGYFRNDDGEEVWFENPLDILQDSGVEIPESGRTIFQQE